MNNVIFALGLTAFAGLSTGIGSAIAFFSRRSKPAFLSVSLGFSAGVMIYVSLVEIMQKAKEALISATNPSVGTWYAVAAFFGGILVIALIDKLIPSYENPHEVQKIESIYEPSKVKDLGKLKRIGVFSAIAIAIHNFPEGLATFVAGLTDPTVALPIAVAIAIHNIPEGIAVSVPLYYATGSRRKAFLLSFLSGLAEPVGALIGYFVLFRFIDEFFFGIVFGAVAGIMVFISLDELLPTAEEYGKHHQAIYGLIGGMLVMGASLALFAA